MLAAIHQSIPVTPPPAPVVPSTPVAELPNVIIETTAVVAEATTTAVDQVKTGVIIAAQWLGKQATWLAGVIGTIAAKVAEAVKPVFESLVSIVKNQALKLKDLVAANQSIAITLTVAVPATALFVIMGSYLFGTNVAKNESEKPQPNPEEVKV